MTPKIYLYIFYIQVTNTQKIFTQIYPELTFDLLTNLLTEY